MNHYAITASVLKFGGYLLTAGLGLALATSVLRYFSPGATPEESQSRGTGRRGGRIVRELYIGALLAYSLNWLFDTLLLKTTSVYGPEVNSLDFVSVHLSVLVFAYGRSPISHQVSVAMFLFGILVFAAGFVAILKPRSRGLLLISAFVLLAATFAGLALKPLGIMTLETAAAMSYSILPGVGFYLLLLCIGFEICGAIVARLGTMGLT